LIKTTKAFQLKEETTWYYQMQGLMAITGIHHTNLAIYTNKGVLIVPVETNESMSSFASLQITAGHRTNVR